MMKKMALTSMLEKAKISSDNPRSIMKRHQLDLNIESAAYMYRPSSIRQRIQRIRNKGFLFKLNYFNNLKFLFTFIID